MPTLAVNKEARHEYNLLQTWETGIRLMGNEVKSAKKGHINLKGAFAKIIKGELLLFGAHINPYKPASGFYTDYVPTRERKLLVKKRELLAMLSALESNCSSALVPDSFYTKGGLVKVALSLGVGKNKRDKRAAIKKREVVRKIRRGEDE